MENVGERIGTIAGIWRYPVQSMRGEALEVADIAASGLLGDRRYGIVDPDVGMVVSSAQGRRKWRGIVTLAACYPVPPSNGDAATPVEVILPDGSRLRSDQRDIDERLAVALGAPVHLADKAAEAKHSDYSHAPLHLLTTASLRQFTKHYPSGRFAPARFRPSILIDVGDRVGFLEQDWTERHLVIGDGPEIVVSEQCRRCVMTTLAQDDLSFDPAILQTITAHNNANAGVYATVVRGGLVRVGEPVRLVA